MSLPPIISIIGPTASGKSDLAVFLAHKFNGEIISADSRQVYKGLDIATGKITKREMRGIPHHLLDVASPKRVFSVTQFQQKGRAAIRDILKRGKLPIVVGGTGFYIDALLMDMTLSPAKPNMSLRKELDKLSTDELYEKLQALDDERAQSIDRHNRVRLIRAIEIATQYGKVAPVTTTSPYDVCTIGIAVEKETLYERVVARIHSRIKRGMFREFARLHAEGLSYARMHMLGLEYRLGAQLLRKDIDRAEFVALLTTQTMQYAKRQHTWFKRNTATHWVPFADREIKAEEIVRAFIGVPRDTQNTRTQRKS